MPLLAEEVVGHILVQGEELMPYRDQGTAEGVAITERGEGDQVGNTKPPVPQVSVEVGGRVAMEQETGISAVL